MEVSAAWEPISVVPLFPLNKSEKSLCKISMATSRQQECLSKHVFTADGLAAVQRRHLVNGLPAMKKAICPSLMFYLWQNSEKRRWITGQNKATQCQLTCKEKEGHSLKSIAAQNHDQTNMFQDFSTFGSLSFVLCCFGLCLFFHEANLWCTAPVTPWWLFALLVLSSD